MLGGRRVARSSFAVSRVDEPAYFAVRTPAIIRWLVRITTRGVRATDDGIRFGASLAGSTYMNWLVWLGLAVIIAAFAAVTGIKSKGTRPVAHSRMMGAGRVALFVLVVIFAYIAYRAHGG